MNDDATPRSDRQQLARYQAELLELLHSSNSSQDALAKFQQLAAATGLETPGDIDPRMLDVAIELTKKWGVKT